MDERKIAIVGDRAEQERIIQALHGIDFAYKIDKASIFTPDPIQNLMRLATVLGAPRHDFSGEPAWKPKGRHQGAKEKARRLRQMRRESR